MMTNTIEHSTFITVKHNETDMTALKTIFQKPVNRPIEGVIKADDDNRVFEFDTPGALFDWVTELLD